MRVQVAHAQLPGLDDANHIDHGARGHGLGQEFENPRHVLRQVLVAGDPVARGVQPFPARDAVALRERVPAPEGDGPRAPAMPDQLAEVGDDDGGVGALAAVQRVGDEVDDGAGREGLLAADPVGEDAEVLVVLAEVEEDALGGGEVGGG